MTGYMTLNAVLSLFVASPSATQGELAQVGGIIVQARTEAPFPLTKVVQVKAVEQGTSRVADSSAADATGRYSLLVEAGTYTVTVSMEGTQLACETLVVAAGSASKDFIIETRRGSKSASERMLAKGKATQDGLIAHASIPTSTPKPNDSN